MSIRTALLSDAPAIGRLLDQLEYPGTAAFLGEKMERILAQGSGDLLVFATEGGSILGLIALDYITQLALPGDFCRISYLVVLERARGGGIGRQLEAAAEERARQRGCDRIEVHCHERRTDAHHFYERQGYTESPKYFIKSLRTGG